MESTSLAVHSLSHFSSVKHLQTRIRNSATVPSDFAFYSRRLMNIICEEAIAIFNAQDVEVVTPTGHVYRGLHGASDDVVVISVIRAGDSMLDVILQILPNASVGKILIQRDEETAKPKLFYHKMPDLTNKVIFLLDPMLATGGSLLMALECCLAKGATIDRICVVNVMSAPEGIEKLHQSYPSLKIVTGEIDKGLNEKKYIIPGVGDFGDRFFNTL